MNRKAQGIFGAALAGSASWLLATSAIAGPFNIPGGTLAAALEAYSAQSGVQVAISSDAVAGAHSKGASGEMSPEQALSRILSGTGLTTRRVGNSVAVVRASSDQSENVSNNLPSLQLAQATVAPRAVETVTVTSSKLGGADVQSIPIAITALSQEQLTATQTSGGPDLVKQVPNLTFTKTNFSGYSINIRGIGTQAISVTTDPAVAIALNDVPFIRNHFFEQEFYDLAQLEVLRGPQGTLYGRNATAGVVNLTTAKPSDQFEAMASGEIGNYQTRRFEGMINLPIVDDRLALRLAGEWTKRDGFALNELDGKRIDGRNLWSGRATIGWKPTPKVQVYLMWEHFQENDDRMRTAKQICTTSEAPETVMGISTGKYSGGVYSNRAYLSQGCKMGSLYGPEAFQHPNMFSLPYYQAMVNVGTLVRNGVDPYGDGVEQSQNYRVVQSQLTPEYKAKNETIELSVDYQLTPSLTFTSQTGYNQDFLWSTSDYSRFQTTVPVFLGGASNPAYGDLFDSNGTFCDPQLGCSNKFVGMDLNQHHAWQLSQEFRLASKFSGPLNFSIGGNYMHYETMEKYYVFINGLSIASTAWVGNRDIPYKPGVTDNYSQCVKDSGGSYQNPNSTRTLTAYCMYIDPNPIGKLNDLGHNYFLSQNPYLLNSYAAFGEAYYDAAADLKFTTGLRWTKDIKHFTSIPSQLLIQGIGYPITGVIDQEWGEVTGRAAVNWTPHLAFTDQTLVYSSYAHGYKAGGANPPGASLPLSANLRPIHPLTFKPEFIDAFELGTKNTLLDGSLTFNASAFYYNYQDYQISQIVDRTAINNNFNAHVKGAEIEATWEPVPGLKFNASGGYQDARIANGESAVDLIDRTAGDPNWMVVKPFPTFPSNCILPTQTVALLVGDANLGSGAKSWGVCADTYIYGLDPVTAKTYVANPTATGHNNPLNQPGQAAVYQYPGLNPLAVPNGGAGISKDLSRHSLPNAAPFTASFGAQYSLPLTSDWGATLRGDFYWQDDSWARVFNDDPYDHIRGYNTVNLTLILTSQSGWQVMLYDKNVFNTTAITGTFLNSDDSGLTTNVFLTDPKLIGIRVTKNW